MKLKQIKQQNNMIVNQILIQLNAPEALATIVNSIDKTMFYPDIDSALIYSDDDFILNTEHPKRFIPNVLAMIKQICLLNINKDDIVLELASSTGYYSAIMAKMAKQVTSIEENKQLFQFAETIVHENNTSNIININNDPKLGYPELAPFDAIIINGAITYIPDTLLQQLTPNGRIVVIHAMEAQQQIIKLMQKKDNSFLPTQCFYNVNANILF